MSSFFVISLNYSLNDLFPVPSSPRIKMLMERIGYYCDIIE